MSRAALLLLLAAGCAGPPEGGYVPGGQRVRPDARKVFAEARYAEAEGNAGRALDLYGELCAEYPLRLGLHFPRLRLARQVLGPEGAAALYDPPPQGVGATRAGILASLARLSREDLPGRRQTLEFATAQEPREAFWRLALADVELSAADIVEARARRERELGMVEPAERSTLEAEAILERARQEAETAAQLDATLAEPHLLLGYVATRLSAIARQPERRDDWRRAAREHYRQSVSMDPDSLHARLGYGENLLYFDEYDDAVRELKRATELAPKDPRTWNGLGLAYWRIGRTADAEACYRRVLELKPADARVRAALADCRRRTGDMDGALRELERASTDALGDRPLASEIAFQLAALHEQRGDFARAVAEYERHIELGGRDSAKAASRIRRLYESSARRRGG